MDLIPEAGLTRREAALSHGEESHEAEVEGVKECPSLDPGHQQGAAGDVGEEEEEADEGGAGDAWPG